MLRTEESRFKMNTNQLKRFAQETRRKLLEQVKAKLDFTLNNDTPELREKQEQVEKLKQALNTSSEDELIEKVAYTWFNRFVALRFMDVNDYQPLGVRVLSPIEGQTSPEILNLAKQGDIPSDLKINEGKVRDLLNGKLASKNPQNEAFKLLLIAACNHLNTVFPFLFERINDYAELLLPDDLSSELSIVADVVESMTAEDCTEVEIIGWLYQFYISEKKDEVFAAKSKVKKEDIPAATQLFTPRWIVEYMVQNTVGKLWLQNRPQSKLRDHMPYYLESPSAEAEDYLKVNSPEELTLLDQACGSGHILVYGFELLSKIYEEEGYNPSEIPGLIIKKNLFGFEIDERAAQLAGMIVLMKAREYQRRFFRKSNVPEPQILCYQDLRLSAEEIEAVLEKLNLKPSDELIHDLGNMRQATNFGSLIIPKASIEEIHKVLKASLKMKETGDAFIQFEAEQLHKALWQLELLAQKYHCVVDNPPYMGGGNANKELSDFVKTNYPDSKADLMACFMETGLAVLHPKGFLGMINQHSWMFLSSYEKLRAKLIENTFFDTLLHLGPRTFPEIGGEVVQNASFTFWNNKIEDQGAYIRLVDFDKSDLKRTKNLEAIQNPDCGWFYRTNQKDFLKIPGSPIGYWLSKKVLGAFESDSIANHFIVRNGISTGNNTKYLKYWYEVTFHSTKWKPCNKGGSYRKWYGNNEYVVEWENDGKEIRTSLDDKGRIKARLGGIEHSFKPGIEMSRITSGKPAFRFSEGGFIYESSTNDIFGSTPTQDLKYLLGYLNSKVVEDLLNLMNPTINIMPEDIRKLPLGVISATDHIISVVNENIEIGKADWNLRDTSWEFLSSPLFLDGVQDLEQAIDLFIQKWIVQFKKLKKNEEIINNHFIELFGLQNEYTSDIKLEEVSILSNESSIVNHKLEFKKDEICASFVHYSIGCMFGRYSLDKEGLILANQGETIQDYLTKVGKPESEVSFLPDDDNIIPVLDDEWFEDDIVGRFHAFLKASFGEQNFRKNLDFVEECLGKDIRKYFTKDFYKDHIKRYKKRPIYWMFSSPEGHFNVLIYLHRYTPDTLNNILNNYLREFIEKIKSSIQQQEHLKISGSAAEKTAASKEISRLEKILKDCQEYEREILFDLAAARISIDLDDGVLVNYNKFGKAIKLVPGLNDKKAKDKVLKFDWIDTSTIR